MFVMKDAKIVELLSNIIIDKIYLYMKLTWLLNKVIKLPILNK